MRRLARVAAMLLAAVATHAAALSRDDFSAVVREIQDAFVNERFDRLEALHDENLARRIDDGTWMIEGFEYAFDATFRSAPLARLEGVFTRWREAAPASRLRPVAAAAMWWQRAMLAHGAGCQPLDDAGKPLASRHLERAQRALEEAGEFISPLRFSIALRVAGGQGARPDRLDRILDQGAAVFPDYLPMYWSRGRFMLPPWSRDFTAFDTFVRTRPPAGLASYAVLYATIARDGCGRLLEETEVSWPQMREGFRALLSAHDTAWNWNLMGTMACRFRDRETTAEVLAKMGGAARLDIWTSGQSTESCRLMIRESAPRPGRDVQVKQGRRASV